MQKSIERDGWLAHEDAQVRARLAMTYAERLLWLEQAKRFAASALGAASPARVAVAAKDRPAR